MIFTFQNLPPLVPGSQHWTLIPQKWGIPCVQVPMEISAMVVRKGTKLGGFPLLKGDWHLMPHGVEWHFGFPQDMVEDPSHHPENPTYEVFPVPEGQQRRDGEIRAFWAALGYPATPMMAVRNHNVRVIGQVQRGFASFGTFRFPDGQTDVFAAGDFIIEEFHPRETHGYRPRIAPRSAVWREFLRVLDTKVPDHPRGDGSNQVLEVFTPHTDPYSL